jgi:hypothetical protein
VKKLNSLIEFLIVNIETRLILTPLFSTFSSCLLFGDESLIKLMNSVGLLLNNLDSKLIEINMNQFLKFFLNALEVRKLESENV